MSDFNKPRKTELLRYADNELDGERADAVAAYLAGDEAAAREIEGLRRLRAITKAEFIARTLPADDQTWTRLGNLIAGAEGLPAPMLTNKPSRIRVSGWKLAATILLGLGLFTVAARWMPRSSDTAARSDELLRPLGDSAPSDQRQQIVLAITRKHVTCAQMQDHFYDQRFSRVLAELPAAAREQLGTSSPVPDLTSLGYEFSGAGGCLIPGGQTFHLLYRAREDSTRCVSVFAQRFTGQLGLAPRGVLLLAGPDAAHPLLCWRDDTTVCYLIADDVQAFTRTQGLLGISLP